MRNSEVLRSDMNKTESIIKKEIMKSETLNTETSKSENKKPENSDLVKVETKKFEETELIYTTRSPKLTSNPILEKNKLKKPQPKSKKTKKNKEMLDNLIERAYETQTVEKKFIDDMEKIDECVYLTKLKNSEENKDKTGQDSDNGDSARIKKILNSSSDFNREYRENLDISPESLSKKFDQVEEKNLNSSSDIRKMNKTKPNEKKRFYSPNASFKNNSVAVDNTEGVLLENDVQKYLQSYESQINYLKVMVYALDKKLAVNFKVLNK